MHSLFPLDTRPPFHKIKIPREEGRRNGVDASPGFPEIATCYGSDMTEHALNHRFRRLRAQAVIIREGRAQGFDMRNLLVEDNMPTAQDAVDRNSTAHDPALFHM